MSGSKVGVCICCHDDGTYLAAVIASFCPLPTFVFVSRVPWHGPAGDWQRCVSIAEAAGARVILGDWPHESLQRRVALAQMKLGFTHALIPDSDEVISPELLQTLLGIAESRTAELVAVHMDTYWRSPAYVVRPREALTPLLLLDLGSAQHVRIREFTGGRRLILPPEFGILHHLSYSGSDERVYRKISSWSHRHEVQPGWFQRVWKGWQSDPMVRDLHPTHPPAYKQIEHIAVPEVLAGIPLEEQEPIVASIDWPTVSVVIPLYGGEQDIQLCLESLALLKDLIHEVVVVDDVSPDSAASVAETFENVILHRNEKNLGFAATCNAGYALTTGEAVIFLNSDTVVPRAGLIRLIESLMASDDIAAAGPYSNNTGHHQQVPSTYLSVETMPLFAEDFARSDYEDKDVDMLVGFCMAIRRTALEKVGLFDTRFGTGMFEDNDLCHRFRRTRMRLVLSRKAFVHHSGSKSLARRKEHPAVLLARNQAIYLKKWHADLECGFVNHLAGMSSEPMVFNESNKPEEIDKRLRRLAKRADICLCMIVKNEERVLAECLESVKNGFTQIVVVDTGSTDRTKEIALSYGVELYEMPWPDNFSAARNVSLSYARSKNVMWIDADDTIDRRSLELVLQAVIHADPSVGGFVVPIRFVDQGPTGGIQVDHLKVFPNLKGIQFEGYIHEQLLSSIRAKGLEVVRIGGAEIRHSGYDVSATGQAVKRAREEKLLERDHEEDPSHPFKMFNLGMTYGARGQHELAIDWLLRCIAASGAEESHVRKAYALLGVARRDLGDLDGALATFEMGLGLTPDDPELLYQSAEVLSRLGRHSQAKARYLQVPSELGGHFSSVDIGILTFKRFHGLGLVCKELGEIAEARAWWKKALEVTPNFSPSAIELFESAFASGDLRGAKEGLAALLVAEGPSESWALRLARLASENGQDPEGALRHAAVSYPYATGLLTVLSRLLLERGDENGAAPILAELDRLGSSEAAFFRGVSAVKRLELYTALEHFLRAQELNPFHDPTHEQIEKLRSILAAELPPALEETGEAILCGPHIGKLGPGTKPTSVILVTYNSVLTISECAERVLATLGENDELIIVDNASKDATQILLQGIAAQHRVRLILNEENLGYSKAANLGILASSGETVVTLNPDAYVYPGWLGAMATHLVDGVGAVGPMSDNIGGDQFVGHLLGSRRPPLESLQEILAAEFGGKSKVTKFLVGICVMSRRETLDKFGLLDEGTELGADDLEFSWRLRMRGHKLVVAQGVFVRHEQGVSFASLPSLERATRQRRSDASLARKLEAYYGPGQIPSSNEVWGTPIFDEALYRYRLLGGDVAK